MCLNWNFIKDVDTPVRLGRCVRGPPSWLWKRSRSWHYRASCPCCSLTVVSGEGGQPILFRYFSPLNFFYQSLRTYIRQKFVWAQSFKTDKRSQTYDSWGRCVPLHVRFRQSCMRENFWSIQLFAPLSEWGKIQKMPKSHQTYFIKVSVELLVR